MKILLLGTPFYSYAEALKISFEKRGHIVKNCILYDKWSSTIIGRIYVKLWNLYKVIKRIPNESYKQPTAVRKKVSESAVKAYLKFKPDVVVNFAAYMITPEALEQMKDCVKLLWIFDSIKNLSKIYSTLPYYKQIYSFEETDIAVFKAMGYECKFLPLCADNRIYYVENNDEKNEKPVDVCFIGHMTKSRVNFFRELHRQMPKINLKIYGVYVGKFNFIGKILRKVRREENYFMNKYLTPDEINNLYNQSKICINVHHNQTKSGGNMRLYEALASGTFEIVDANPYIEREFRDCVGIYHNNAEMVELIKYYLIICNI